MGTISSAYMPLMKMLVDKFKDAPHRFIVAKGNLNQKLNIIHLYIYIYLGSQHDKYHLPCNMWGENFLPQTKVCLINNFQ